MSTAAHIADRRSPLREVAFDVGAVRRQFPILETTIGGKPLVYLDNAATSQKPVAVLDAVRGFYTSDCANTHRAVHLLGERATLAYEAARRKVQRFLGAEHEHEIVFLRGATEAINLVAQSLGAGRLRPGDEIVISAMEHHANIVPWQMLSESKGTVLRVAPVDDRGDLLLDEFERLLGPRTRLVAVAHVSNVLGTVVPVREIVDMAHGRGVAVLVDGAQAIPHLGVDVRALDCDFYVFSGHKLYGPTGIGVLYGKAELLESMPPYQGGGGMIRSVTFEKTVYEDSPRKFEAGTPNIAGAIGLGAAIDFLSEIGLGSIGLYEESLLSYAAEALAQVPGVRLIGSPRQRVAILSFVVDGVHPHDVGTILDHEGIATRTGHHCAQPLMERLRVPATTRVSLALYNTREEIDAVVRALDVVKEVFR